MACFALFSQIISSTNDNRTSLIVVSTMSGSLPMSAPGNAIVYALFMLDLNRLIQYEIDLVVHWHALSIIFRCTGRFSYVQGVECLIDCLWWTQEVSALGRWSLPYLIDLLFLTCLVQPWISCRKFCAPSINTTVQSPRLGLIVKQSSHILNMES